MPLEVQGHTVPHLKALRHVKDGPKGLSWITTLMPVEGVLKNGNLLHKWSLVETQLLRTVRVYYKNFGDDQESKFWISGNNFLSFFQKVGCSKNYLFEKFRLWPRWLRSCPPSVPLLAKQAEQNLHLYGFSPVWILLWSFSLWISVKPLPQTSHLNFFSSFGACCIKWYFIRDSPRIRVHLRFEIPCAPNLNHYFNLKSCPNVRALHFSVFHLVSFWCTVSAFLSKSKPCYFLMSN